MANQIACPNCGEGIDVNSLLYHQVESALKKQFSDEMAREKSQYQERLAQIEQQQQELERAKQQQQQYTENAIAAGIKEQEEKITQSLKTKLEAEQSGQLEALNKELAEKSEQVKALHRAKSDIARLQREKGELREAIEAENQQHLNQALAEHKDKISRNVEQKSKLEVAEKEKVIADLSQQLKDAQRRVEQGSTQLQGEVQELAIEQWLRDQFPLDTVEEIKKGVSGADCLQIVHTRQKQNCGSIYYESKRTKAFSGSWVEKFKQDIREKGADVGVLVTQTMPADMPHMGLKDGVWICSFEEFPGLAIVLRDAAIRMSNAIVSQENKGDKMGMLYDFLTGQEFRQQVEAIVEGFTQLQQDLEAEKRAMQRIWKQREKQIEKVLLNTNHMYGAIKGIAGNAIQPVGLLELDQE